MISGAVLYYLYVEILTSILNWSLRLLKHVVNLAYLIGLKFEPHKPFIYPIYAT